MDYLQMSARDACPDTRIGEKWHGKHSECAVCKHRHARRILTIIRLEAVSRCGSVQVISSQLRNGRVVQYLPYSVQSARNGHLEPFSS